MVNNRMTKSTPVNFSARTITPVNRKPPQAHRRSSWYPLGVGIININYGLLIGLICVATALGCGSNSTSLTPTLDEPAINSEPPTTSFDCPSCEAFSVGRVIDGDTLDLVDGARVRLYGVDTPERGEPCFTEATDRLRQLAGNTMRLENGPRATDSFGRRLAYAYTLEGFSIDVILIGDGLAEAWRRDGQHRDTLVGLEQSARSNNAGCLWG